MNTEPSEREEAPERSCEGAGVIPTKNGFQVIHCAKCNRDWSSLRAFENHECIMRIELIYWLLRAYQSGHREGWEDGPSVADTMDRICDVLSNLGYDPSSDKARGLLLEFGLRSSQTIESINQQRLQQRGTVASGVNKNAERLKEIRENRQVWYNGMGQVTKDIDFLLSLLDSQATTKPTGWISCGLRQGRDDRIVDIVFENAECAKAFIDGVEPTVGPIVAATRMRERCVGRVKEMIRRRETTVEELIAGLESLTLESESGGQHDD